MKHIALQNIQEADYFIKEGEITVLISHINNTPLQSKPQETFIYKNISSLEKEGKAQIQYRILKFMVVISYVERFSNNDDNI